MIKTIIITKEYKTIPENFELKLERMTVITGENNSGKTNFVSVINGGENVEFFDENLKKITPKIIYIAAENIKPSDSECKFSAKSTGLIENLSKLFSNLEIKFNLEKKDIIIKEIKDLIEKTNKNLENFTGSNQHKLTIDHKDEIDSNIIIQALIKDIKGKEDEQKRKLEDLGQGTQRIIVASILKAYIDILIEKKIHGKKPILILFEEPEIYLHPKLKRTLNTMLGKIAEQDNHQVIITTHDPYFAYTNLKDERSVIYSFFKNSDSNTEKKEPDVIFGIDDELLHIHLFEKVLRKMKTAEIIDINKKYLMNENCPINKYLKKYCGSETRDNIWPDGKTHNLALPLHIRHVIHHPLDERNRFTSDDLEKSIVILNKILSD